MQGSHSTVELPQGLVRHQRTEDRRIATFTVRDVKRGTRIIEERPLLTVADATSPTEIYTSFLAASGQQKATYLSLYYHDSTRNFYQTQINNNQLRVLSTSCARRLGINDGFLEAAKVLGIFDCNNIPGRNASGGDIVPSVSKMRHSCSPNAKVKWNETLSAYTVHAVTHIQAGDEVCVSYVNALEDLKTRQEHLSGLRILCACIACDFSPTPPDEPERPAHEIARTRFEVYKRLTWIDHPATDAENLYSEIIDYLDEDCMIEMIEFKVQAYEGRAEERIKNFNPTAEASCPALAQEDLKQAIFWADICYGHDGDKTKELRDKIRALRIEWPDLRKRIPSSLYQVNGVLGSVDSLLVAPLRSPGIGYAL